VAELIRELHAARIAAVDAVAEGGARWPFPAEGMTHAVTAGYLQLDGSGIPGA
jgi:hypothetical protein